jgi:hypothetical protein
MDSVDHNRTASREQGLAIIEMMISLPFLLLLLLATAEFGRAFYEYNTLTKSARDGVRYAAQYALLGGKIDLDQVQKFNGETLRDNIKSLVAFGTTQVGGTPILTGLAPEDIQVSVAPDPVHIQVLATYTYRPIFGGRIPTFGIGGGDIDSALTLRAQATMRAL